MSGDPANSRTPASSGSDDPPIPRHIAIVMDGNGRWAKARGLARTAGHQAGVQAARRVVEACAQRGVGALSLFAFSSENWRRPRQEVGLLMELFARTLRREIQSLHENGVCLRFIGERAALASNLRDELSAAEELTAANTGLQLVIAMNYGGRWDIAQAARGLAEAVREGTLDPQAVTADAVEARLSTAGLAEPDLFVRTGGEQRISNFLLWQLAYTELYFTETLWPEFDENELDRAIASYGNRQRRFGQTGEQLGPQENA